ncbi:MAG: peptidoglycan DD-metalloendopeptidase family protein [Gammaproteobacteria bacterium]
MKSTARIRAVAAACVVALAGAALADELYEYRDENGSVVYSDRPPEDGQAFERRTRASGSSAPPRVTIRVERSGDALDLWADNDCYCPAEVALQLTDGSYSDVAPDSAVRNVVPALGSVRLMSLRAARTGTQPDFRFGFIFGDPQARHAPSRGYRPPFAAGREFRVTQAFPESLTHVTPDSRYAIDLSMPERTDIYAAREGVVVEVAYSNFRGGADWGKYGAEANLVRIMHDDGSFAVYAHLSWDSIRVRPGDRVERGEYIATSGNTGFSTGPHLHFVVLRNEGLRSVSVPVVFSDGRGGLVTAKSGEYLKNP